MMFLKSHNEKLIDCLRNGKRFDISEKDLEYLQKEGYFKPVTEHHKLDEYFKNSGCNKVCPECLEFEDQLKAALDDGRRVFYNGLKSGKKVVCTYKCLAILPAKSEAI